MTRAAKGWVQSNECNRRPDHGVSPLREPVRAPAPAEPALCADFFAAVGDGVAIGIEASRRSRDPNDVAPVDGLLNLHTTLRMTLYSRTHQPPNGTSSAGASLGSPATPPLRCPRHSFSAWFIGHGTGLLLAAFQRACHRRARGPAAGLSVIASSPWVMARKIRERRHGRWRGEYRDDYRDYRRGSTVATATTKPASGWSRVGPERLGFRRFQVSFRALLRSQQFQRLGATISSRPRI